MPLREAQVQQAVNFLANPASLSTTWEKKKAFLEGKGLTAEEVEEAKRRSDDKAESDARKSVAAMAAAATATSAASAGASLWPPGYGPGGAAGQSTAAAGVLPIAQNFYTPGAARAFTAQAVPAQAVLLLRRRLAELEHERVCYLEALSALGDLPEPPLLAPARAQTATAQPPVLASPPPTPAAAPAAKVDEVSAASAPAPAKPSQPTPLPPVESSNATPPAATSTPARKPWETATPVNAAGIVGPKEPATSAGTALGGPLRDDDPDLMEILPSPKRRPA